MAPTIPATILIILVLKIFHLYTSHIPMVAQHRPALIQFIFGDVSNAPIAKQTAARMKKMMLFIGPRFALQLRTHKAIFCLKQLPHAG